MQSTNFLEIGSQRSKKTENAYNGLMSDVCEVLERVELVLLEGLEEHLAHLRRLRPGLSVLFALALLLFLYSHQNTSVLWNGGGGCERKRELATIEQSIE